MCGIGGRRIVMGRKRSEGIASFLESRVSGMGGVGKEGGLDRVTGPKQLWP